MSSDLLTGATGIAPADTLTDRLGRLWRSGIGAMMPDEINYIGRLDALGGAGIPNATIDPMSLAAVSGTLPTPAPPAEPEHPLTQIAKAAAPPAAGTVIPKTEPAAAAPNAAAAQMKTAFTDADLGKPQAALPKQNLTGLREHAFQPSADPLLADPSMPGGLDMSIANLTGAARSREILNALHDQREGGIVGDAQANAELAKLGELERNPNAALDAETRARQEVARTQASAPADAIGEAARGYLAAVKQIAALPLPEAEKQARLKIAEDIFNRQTQAINPRATY